MDTNEIHSVGPAKHDIYHAAVVSSMAIVGHRIAADELSLCTITVKLDEMSSLIVSSHLVPVKNPAENSAHH